MKPSGLEWVGDIPTDWNVEPFFNVMPQSGRPNSGLTEVNLLSLSYGQIIRKDIDSNDGLLPASFETYQIVEPGDIVFRFTDLQNDKRSLRSALVRERGIITSAYLAVSPEACLPTYADFLMRSYDTTKVFYSFGGGVRQSLTYSDVKRLPVLVPPIETQRAIVGFLNRETAQIDALIGKQERLVDVLRERRSALIARTLTAGLDPAVETAPSRTDWLGNLPEHWQTVPTRYLCKITTGSEDSGNAEDDGEYPLYVRGREILRIGHYSFDCEAVMTPGDGQGGTGKVFHYFNGKFEAHQRVYVFKDFRNLLGRFFYYYLSTFLQPVALAGSNTVTMESLRRPLLAAFPVALPPIEEQGRIVDYLDRETVKIDALIGKAKAMNVVLRERRAALISAAVTGKIDVTKRIEGAA